MARGQSAVGISALGLSSSGKATTPGANIHANPQIKPPQHAQCARGAKVARGRRIASLHDPSAHEKGNVDANRLVV